MAVEVKPVTSSEEWEAFMVTHPEANFLHSWDWGDFYADLGQTVYWRGFYRGASLVGVMLAIVEPAKRGRYLAVPGGPIIDWQDQEVVAAFVADLKHLGKQERCVFARVRPQLLENAENAKLFASLGFKRANMHLHAEFTSQLDITPDEDALLANFRKQTRYELRQAKKRGIKVTSTDVHDEIAGFYQLQLQTAQRHGFVPYGEEFLTRQFKTFADDGKALLYSAHTKDGQLIAQAFVIFYNQEAAYHYGASTELGRTEPGAYLIQWEAIKEAKRRGMTRYNFWGVVRPEETSHRFYGVSVFKRGFRGEDVEYLHARDLVLSRPRHAVTWAVEFVRKHRRHL